jgi:hypothetical protein
VIISSSPLAGFGVITAVFVVKAATLEAVIRELSAVLIAPLVA